MKRMRWTGVLGMLVLGIQGATAAGPGSEPSEEMGIFLESCRLLNRGVEERDEALVADASEGFGEIEITEMDAGEFSCNTEDLKVLDLPEIQYNYEFCDVVRKANFDIVKRSALALNRDVTAAQPISTVSRTLSPRSSVTFTLSGAEDMELSLPTTSPADLQLKITCEGVEVPVMTDPGTGFSYARWDMGATEAPFTVTVTNFGDKNASFAIAMK